MPLQIRSRFPVVPGWLDGWNIDVWNPTAGWAAAGDALQLVVKSAGQNGVDSISGETNGWVRRLILNKITDECKGAVTADGTRFVEDVVIVIAGPWISSLLDMKSHVVCNFSGLYKLETCQAWRGVVVNPEKYREDLRGR